MDKFDASCGLTKKQIGIIKFAVKNEVLRHLPILPELIETKLFLQGKDAWIYSWNLSDQQPAGSEDKISLEVVVNLKRGFHSYEKCTQYRFLCMVQMGRNIYRPRISIIKKAASPAAPDRP
jgi:hypothetical protein